MLNSPPTFIVDTLNYCELRVCLYRFDLLEHLFYWDQPNEAKSMDDRIDYFKFGDKIFDKIIKLPGYADNQRIKYPIDLSPALKDGCGQIGVIVTPSDYAHSPNSTPKPIIKAWLQITKLCIDLFPSIGEAHFWVTDLKNP